VPIEHAPFDRTTGELLHYVRDAADAQIDWRPNTPFEAELRLDGIHRGRSSVYTVWLDAAAAQAADANDAAPGVPVPRYPMFMIDLMDLLRARGVRKGARVAGRWLVVKRGMNYGVQYLPD
jgi:hypothetical protein